MRRKSRQVLSRRPSLEILEERVALDASLSFALDHWDTREDWGFKPIYLERQGDTSSVMSVDLSTVAGSALPGQDYDPLNTTVVFQPGESIKQVDLHLINDLVIEELETLAVELSNPTGPGATLGAISTSVVKIANDDAAFKLYYDHWNTQENWGFKSIYVVRQGDTNSAMSVKLTTVAGSAQPGQDYQPLATTLAFAAGEATKTVNLQLIDDAVYEGPESLTVVLSNPAGGATLGTPSSAVVNIADNDPAPGSGASFRFYYSQWNTQENWGFKPIYVVRQGDLSSAMSVQLATVAGSALPGQDYQPLETVVSFAAGESTKTVNLHLINDTLVEDLESLTVVLSNPTGINATLGAPSTAVVNIANDDTDFEFYYDHWNTQEDWGYEPITVVRRGFTGAVMTVDLATVAGSAQPGEDYQPWQQTVTFAVGESIKNVNLHVINDAAVEGTETLGVLLSNPTGGAHLGTVSTAIVSIADNDVASQGTLQFAYETFTTHEGWGFAVLYVTRSGGSMGTVSVDYSFSDGSAENGSDFIGANGTLMFADGETMKTIIVPLLNDSSPEGPESLLIELDNPQGGALLSDLTFALLNILDDDF